MGCGSGLGPGLEPHGGVFLFLCVELDVSAAILLPSVGPLSLSLYVCMQGYAARVGATDCSGFMVLYSGDGSYFVG